MARQIKHIIPQSLAIKLMLILLTLVFFFHLAVITQLIPYHIVWAGKLTSASEMYKYEFISVTVLIINVFVLLLKGNYIPNKWPRSITNVFIFLFSVLFLLNAIGNLFSKTNFELYVFSPVALIASLLSFSIFYSDISSKSNR